MPESISHERKKIEADFKFMSHIVVVFILLIILPMQASALTIKSGQVRLHSDGGWAIYNETISGLTPGTTAVVVLEGWGIISDYPNDRTVAIYLWDIAANYWATEFPVLNDGTIQVRFIGVYSDTHPFDMIINYAVIGQ